MPDYYINPATGNDSTGTGTEISPWATFSRVNSGNLWIRGNRILVRRGTTMLVNPGNRANIVCTTGTGRCVLSTYGSGEKPIIDANYETHNPVWVRSGSGIDIEDIQITKSASIGLKVSPLNGLSVSDVRISRVRSYANGMMNSTGSGSTGILVTREIGGLSCTDVIVTDCLADLNRGHGIKFADCATGKVIRSIASRNGQGAPAHGMGTVGAYVWLNRSSDWVNVSGNIWSINIGALGPVANNQSITASQNITEWLSVTAGDTSTITTAAQTHLTKSINPVNPGANEFGINGQNTLLVNMNGLDPRQLFIKAAFNAPVVTFYNCIAEYTRDHDGYEGQGFQFDDLTIKCKVISCISRYNEGYGFCTFGGTDNLFLKSLAHHNLKGGAFGLVSKNFKLIGNTFISNGTNKRAIEVFKGVDTLARHNTIINESVGFFSNNQNEFRIIENNNKLINVTTPRTNVLTGSRSITTTKRFGILNPVT